MLNKNQKKAVDYYIKSNNGYEALIKAGYKEGFAKRYASFFERDEIKEYMNKRTGSNATDTKSEIISYLTKVMRGEDSDATATQRIKAAEMLSKHYGLDKLKEKEDTSTPVVIYDNIKKDN